MIEVIKHTLGFCGEHWHPNLFTALAGGLGFAPSISYLYYKVKKRRSEG
jgi:hypothetical protein